VYIKLETSSPTFAYYRVYTTGNVNRFYSFRPEMLTTKFDDTIFSDPKKLVIPISSIYNGSIRARSEGSLDQMRGESIYLVDTNDLAPREARLARVPEKSKPREVNVKGQKYFEIGLETLDNVSLFKEFASNSILSKRAKLAARAVSIVNDSRAVAMARTYMYKGAVAVTSDMFNPESTAEELIEVVNNLPESSMYIVSDSIINTIYEEFPSKALKLAKALNEKTSYYHPIIDDAVKPSNIERELTKLANYSSIVSERIFKAKLLSTDNGLLLDAESISKAKMARIALGTILDVGVINSKQTYAYVRSISEQGVSVTLFGQDIFESLDSPVYSQEGFDTILKENIKC
jgi:hypothetical protein